MKETLRKFRTLEKKDQLILFLMFSTIGNFIMAVIKFVLSLTIPSLWFFVNGGFCLILAIYGMIKYKKNKDPIIKGIKITNFANALTSIVLTQVVLLDTYANEYDSTLNGYTGMGVSMIIMALGLYMIISAKKDL